MAAGVPDELYWRSTPVETGALLDQIAEREMQDIRAATLRAGLVAAAIYNVHRKKGTPAIQAKAFLREPVKVVKPQNLAQALSTWASDHNRRIAAAEETKLLPAKASE